MIQQLTTPTKQNDIKRTWHLIDAEGETLGRLATKVAEILMGKSKPYFVRNLDCGDYVVITNAKVITVTGKKEEQKVYNRHSGYPGGFRSETLKELRSRRPEEVIRRSVKGMLPDNKLADRMITRLYVFSGTEHRFSDKFALKEEPKV
jgi:large subunit ribosomal protein L13